MANPAMLAKRLIETIFSPLGIMAILLIIGVILSIPRRRSRYGHRFLICGAVLFLVYLFSPLSVYVNYGLEKNFPPLLTPPESPKISRIVVLAGYAWENPGIPINSRVSWSTLGSISEGLRLYRRVPGAKLIISGGIAHNGQRPVSALMADCFQQMGVPATDLIVEGNSRDTYENLVEVRKLIGSDPFILVAAGCDLRRAVAVAKKLQMNPIPAPANIWTLQYHPNSTSALKHVALFFASLGAPSLENLSRLQWAYHEYLGYIWYRLLRRI